MFVECFVPLLGLEIRVHGELLIKRQSPCGTGRDSRLARRIAADQRLGKTDNCQVAVSLSIANAQGSVPLAYQLYLPQDWASDRARRERAGVPPEIEFRTKGAIALEQIQQAITGGLSHGVVLADAAC
jgi:SRSO17 transposase